MQQLIIEIRDALVSAIMRKDTITEQSLLKLKELAEQCLKTEEVLKAHYSTMQESTQCPQQQRFSQY